VRLDGDCSQLSYALSDDANCGVVFDGVLYSPLAEPESAFPHNSAATTVMKSYLDQGLKLLDGLDGEFSVLIWDGRRDLCICIRDPVGRRPLFYAHVGTNIFVSPSPDALARHDAVNATPDAGLIAEWVYRGATPLGATLYSTVRRLPQGHLLEASGTRPLMRRYWDTKIAVGRPRTDVEEALESFDRLLDRAVARELGPDRAGILLSGGVDSALVAASATATLQRQGKQPPLALCVKFPIPEADEEEVQRAIARDLGMEALIVSIESPTRPDGVLLATTKLSSRSWFPSVNPWVAAYDALLETAKREGCEVLLDGEGGNQLLEVRPQWAADRLLRGDVIALAEMWRAEQQYTRRGRLKLAKFLLFDSGLRPIAREFAHGRLRRLSMGASRKWLVRRAHGALPAWLAPDPRVRGALIESLAAPRVAGKSRSLYARVLERSLDNVADSMLLEGSFLTTRTSLVRRPSPYYDSALIGFAHSVSPRVLFLGSRYKGIAYESYRRRAPGKTAEKLGVARPARYFSHLLDRDGPSVLQYLGGLRCLEQMGIIETGRAGELLRDQVSLTPYQRWQLLATEAWLRGRLGS
jgi:asparagine synthetase B (glutamine-hydrolysing)